MVGKKGVNRLNEFPSCRGGDTLVTPQGYVMEFAPAHVDANSWGWVAQHRLVGEDLVGRPLRVSKDPKVQECVHHLDHDPLNNDVLNLQVLTTSEHRALHSRAMAAARLAKITGEQVTAALQGRTIAQAARHLGVDKQTLRNRYPERIAHRQRASPNNYRDPALAERIRAYAVDPTKSWKQCYQELHLSPATLSKAAKHHKIVWTDVPRPGRPARRASATAPGGADPK